MWTSVFFGGLQVTGIGTQEKVYFEDGDVS